MKSGMIKYDSTYIPSANIMTNATMIGIDSCSVEDFKQKKNGRYSKNRFRYCVNEPKTRRKLKL